MRPDLDEYEELNPELDAPRSRAMSWIVLGVAVIGFGALAYYAYQSGSQSVADGQMLVVEAEQGPIKEAPVDAGGEEFPHKDKTIYDALSPYRTDQKVETLLPAAEEPVIPEPAVNTTETAPAPKPAETTSYVKPEPKPVEEKPAAEPKPAEKVETAPVAKPVETVEVKDAIVATKATPAPVAPKAEPKPEPKPVVKAEPKPAPKPAPAASGGNYKIQLGALGSEAEARTLWSKVTAKHGDVVKGSPIIVKAEVNGKTYYRLRASGFASAADAKAACAKLSGRGQACLPAGQ